MAESAGSAGVLHRPICPEGGNAVDLPCTNPCAKNKRPFVLAATILASAMAFIDGSVVNIALPTLQKDLGASFAMLQWVVHAYALVLGSVILVGGGLGDRYGRKRVFVAGIIVFALSSVGCALASSVEVLIAARGVQGLGAALLVPQSLAIIAANFSKEVRGKAIGIWSGASAITTSLGPPLGGFLIDALDWSAVFWINIPLSFVTLWLAVTFIPESRNDTNQGRLDWQGAVIAVIAFGALTLGLTQLSESEGSVFFLFLLVTLGLAGIGLFAAVEKKAPNPLVPPGLFADKGFTGANIMTLFLYGALSGVLFLLPFDLIARRELTASQVGLTMLPFGVIIGLFSRYSGNWADRRGPRGPLVTGSVLVASAGAVFALEVAGETVARAGNVMNVNGTEVAVAEACSGLRMLTAFIVVSAFMAYMVKRPRWQKAVLLASSVPIAIFSNIFRLFVTAEAFAHVSQSAGEAFHDAAGLAMMPPAVFLLVGELWIMKRLVIPEPHDEKQSARPARAAGTSAEKASRKTRAEQEPARARA
jgi:EmrB/QacA subfamily drug resistance transporter